jgi:hypothetical protein
MKYICEIEIIQWTGDNTEEVVEFCVENDYDLCRSYYIDTETLIDDILVIEPSDTMRKSCLNIKKNEYVISLPFMGVTTVIESILNEEIENKKLRKKETL